MLIWLEIRKAVQERYFSNRNSVEFFIWAHDKDYKTVKARIEKFTKTTFNIIICYNKIPETQFANVLDS